MTKGAIRACSERRVALTRGGFERRVQEVLDVRAIRRAIHRVVHEEADQRPVGGDRGGRGRRAVPTLRRRRPPPPTAAAGHRQIVVPRNPEQPVAMPRAAIQVVVVRREAAVGVEVADDGVGGEPAQEPVDVESRLEPAPPRVAVGPRSVQRRNRILDVGPVLVAGVGALREVVADEDRPAAAGAVRLVEVAVVADRTAASDRRVGHLGHRVEPEVARSRCRCPGTRG